MSTINVELNPNPVNISQNLVPKKTYTVQLMSTVGSTACYLFVAGNVFPSPPPKCAHLLIKHRHMQLRVPPGESIWAWVGGGVEAVLVITEAENLKGM